MATLIENIYEQMDLTTRDLFDRLKDLGVIKFNVMKKHPRAFDFLNSTAKETDLAVKSIVDELGKSLIKDGLHKIFENIDMSKFRPDLDFSKVMKMINWTMLGLSDEQRNRLNSFSGITPEILREWDDYFDLMKRCFYKEEGL